MTEEEHKRLLLAVRDLDAIVPTPKAVVLITTEVEEDTGVPELQTITATRDGFLRLGVEMLKAATITPCQPQEDGSLELDLDLSALLSPESELSEFRFLLVDSLPEPQEMPSPLPTLTPTWKDRMTDLFWNGFLCLLALTFIVGVATIVFFILKLFHIGN